MDIDFLSSFYPEMYFKDGFAIHVVATRLDYYFIKKLEIGNKNCLGIFLLSYSPCGTYIFVFNNYPAKSRGISPDT